MKIEIDVPGRDELKEQIIETAASQLLDGRRVDGKSAYDDDGYRIEGAMRSEIMEKVVELLGSKLDAEVTRLVTDALNGTVQPTNSIGEPKGAPISFRERIAAMVQEWFDTKVDSFGKPISQGNYEYNRSKTRGEHAIEQAVNDVCSRQLQDAIGAAVRDLKAQVGSKVSAATSDAVKRLLNLPV